MTIGEARATPVNVDHREFERRSHGHRLGVTSIAAEADTGQEDA